MKQLAELMFNLIPVAFDKLAQVPDDTLIFLTIRGADY